jgi:hypothetical protein
MASYHPQRHKRIVSVARSIRSPYCIHWRRICPIPVVVLVRYVPNYEGMKLHDVPISHRTLERKLASTREIPHFGKSCMDFGDQ